MTNPLLLQIEYNFALAQAEAYRAKAEAIKALLEVPPNRAVEGPREEQQPGDPHTVTSVTSPEVTDVQDGTPPLIEALQRVIGDASNTTVDQIFHALREKDWVPLGSRDPLTYVRHTLSKNKDLFLREQRGRYTLAAENPYKKIPTSVEPNVRPSSPVQPPVSTPEYSQEEIDAANAVVEQVLSMHKAATGFPPPRPAQEAARIIHASVNPNSQIAQEVREMVCKNAESVPL